MMFVCKKRFGNSFCGEGGRGKEFRKKEKREPQRVGGTSSFFYEGMSIPIWGKI